MYQHRLGGVCTEHPTLSAALKDSPFAKVSFTVDESSRLMLWDDGTWTLRTLEGEWIDGKFKTWEQIASEYDVRLAEIQPSKE